MARTRVTISGLTTIAITVVEKQGLDALSLSSVASRLGVRPSALYTHVNGVEGLRYLVAVNATRNLTDDIRRAAIGVGGGKALQTVGQAYRAFALNSPGQFRATLTAPRSADDELTKANDDLVEVFALVFAAMGLEAETAKLAARSTRSALHGFCALEVAMGTSADHDAQYQHLLDTLEQGLQPTKG